MKKSLIIVLVLSMVVGMASLGSFAAVQNYQNGGGMMGDNYAGRGSMMGGNYAGRGGMMGGNYSGRGGMMGYGNSLGNAGVTSENAISMDDAYKVANTYLEKEVSTDYTLNKEGVAFGNSYMFFMQSSDKTVGRLSVNALTSEVWLHNCRALLQ